MERIRAKQEKHRHSQARRGHLQGSLDPSQESGECVHAWWSLPASVPCGIPQGFQPNHPVPLGHSLSPRATWPARDCPSALVVCPAPHTAPHVACPFAALGAPR